MTLPDRDVLLRYDDLFGSTLSAMAFHAEDRRDNGAQPDRHAVVLRMSTGEVVSLDRG